jgi:hypothetical protein
VRRKEGPPKCRSCPSRSKIGSVRTGPQLKPACSRRRPQQAHPWSHSGPSQPASQPASCCCAGAQHMGQRLIRLDGFNPCGTCCRGASSSCQSAHWSAMARHQQSYGALKKCQEKRKQKKFPLGLTYRRWPPLRSPHTTQHAWRAPPPPGCRRRSAASPGRRCRCQSPPPGVRGAGPCGLWTMCMPFGGACRAELGSHACSRAWDCAGCGAAVPTMSRADAPRVRS